MKNTSEIIPSDFPNHYATQQERAENWAAFNLMREMFNCPTEYDYKKAHAWIGNLLLSPKIFGGMK